MSEISTNKEMVGRRAASMGGAKRQSGELTVEEEEEPVVAGKTPGAPQVKLAKWHSGSQLSAGDPGAAHTKRAPPPAAAAVAPLPVAPAPAAAAAPPPAAAAMGTKAAAAAVAIKKPTKPGIVMKLGPSRGSKAGGGATAAAAAAAVPSLLQRKSSLVAAAFGNGSDSDDQQDEMPPEARMKMKNLGRNTPTSAGPNSFCKGKIGFCNSRKLAEKELQQCRNE